MDDIIPALTYEELALLFLETTAIEEFSFKYDGIINARLALADLDPSDPEDVNHIEFWTHQLDKCQQAAESYRWALQQRMEEIVAKREETERED